MSTMIMCADPAAFPSVYISYQLGRFLDSKGFLGTGVGNAEVPEITKKPFASVIQRISKSSSYTNISAVGLKTRVRWSRIISGMICLLKKPIGLTDNSTGGSRLGWSLRSGCTFISHANALFTCSYRRTFVVYRARAIR